jgi:threonine aldolase
MITIDLRSDTVTLPSPEMLDAMARAPLGDDVFGEDPTVRALEAHAAHVLGKEAALFVPSGTMGNLLATMTHTQPGDELICGPAMHTFSSEAGGAARIAGVSTRLVPQREAWVDPADVVSAIRADDPHYPRTALVWVEQPHMGWIMPMDNLAAVATVAREHGLAVHMDGARIFNAAVALGIPARDIARHADTVMCCISKGLAAPVGSLLAGPEPFIARARRNRKVLGGGMRQAGVIAAAGLYALDRMVDRLEEDHRTARRLADGLRSLGWRIDRDVPQTNIFLAEPPPGTNSDDLPSRLDARGVRVHWPAGSPRVRLVTHYGIEMSDIDHAIDVFASVSATRSPVSP